MELVQLGVIGGEPVVGHVQESQLHNSKWIVVVHGLGEYGMLYHGYFSKLSGNEMFSFLFLDLPGHGESGGKPGDIRRFRDFEDALKLANQFVQERSQEKHIVVAHSLGGTVTLSYLFRERPAAIKAAFILSPWLNLVDEMSRIQAFLIRIGYFLFPSFVVRRSWNGSEPREELLGKNKGHDKISFRLYLQTFWRSQRLRRVAKRFTLPLHFYHAKFDPLTFSQSTKDFVNKIETPASLSLLDADVHELMESKFKEQIWGDILELFSK